MLEKDLLRLTLTRSANGEAVRKKMRQRADGSVEKLTDYPGLTYWKREIHEIPLDIDAFHAFLQQISAIPDACLVTGEPCGDLPLDTKARRIKNTHAKGDLPTLAECSAAWLPIDCDDIPIQGRLDPLDPELAIAEVVSQLGAPFIESSYVWQLSASASPGADKIRVRLFFLLNQAISNDTRRAWANAHNALTGIKLIDRALFTATQPIYTAAPEFEGRDPFPRRIGVVYGENEILPWDSILLPAQEGYQFRGTVERGAVHRSIEERLSAIGDHEGGEGCHDAIRDAIISMVGKKWTSERIKDTIRQTVADAVWTGGHDERYLKTETSDYKLNASIKGAETLLKATENAPRVTQTRPVTDTVALPVAMLQMQEVVSRLVRGEGSKRIVLAVTVGAGKTHSTVEAVKASLPADQNIVWAFPTHNQGEEVRGQMVRDDFGSEFAIKIEGRVREAEGVEPMCRRPDLIKEIRQAGLQGRTQSIACKAGEVECPHYRGCAYYRQFRGDHRVRLVAHSTLTTPKAKAISDQFMDSCSLLVIDESPIDTLLGRKSYPLGEILTGGGNILEAVDMMRTGVDPETIDPLIYADLCNRLEAERDDRCVIDSLIHTPSAQDEWGLMQELKLKAESKKPSLYPLYQSALSWLRGDKNLFWMGKDKHGDAVFCAWRHEIPDIERILVLDATPNEDAYRAILGDDVEIIRISVEQNLEVIQAYDTPLGKRKLINPDQDDVLAQIMSLARGMDAPLISNKAAIQLAKDKGYLPEGYPVGHFNALRGLNAMEKFDSLVIAGRPEPDALEVEAKARSLYPREDLTLSGAYRAGTDGISSVFCHPDPRCDGLLRTFREAEIEQAIGRLRAVRSSKTKRVYLLTHTPITLPGVKQVRLNEIIPPVGLARLYLKTGGIAPIWPEFMSATLPEIWATPKAAERWVERVLKPPFPLCIYLHKAEGGFKFRRRGQKRASLCLSWHDREDTWEMLEKVLMTDVVECQGLGVKEEPPATPPQEVQAVTEAPTIRWEKPTFRVIPLHDLIPKIRDTIAAIFEIPPPPLIDPIAQFAGVPA